MSANKFLKILLGAIMIVIFFVFIIFEIKTQNRWPKQIVFASHSKIKAPIVSTSSESSVPGVGFLENKTLATAATSEIKNSPGAKQLEVSRASSSDVKLLFWGDFMLDRQVLEKIKKQGSTDWILGGLKKELDFSQFDLVSANLEGAVTNGGQHYPPQNLYDFAFNPRWVADFKSTIVFFNLSNNHILDQGRAGYAETQKNLTDLGFKFSGCPDREVGACSATTTIIKGKKITMVGLSMVYAIFDLKKAEAIIKEAKSGSNLIIVNIHWGKEYEHNSSALQKSTAHALIDSGADVIIGHHPHVVEGKEMYKGKPIFYSLGNFVFDQYFSQDTQEELGVELDFASAEQPQVKLIPVKSEQNKIRLMNEQEKSIFLEKLESWN